MYTNLEHLLEAIAKRRHRVDLGNTTCRVTILRCIYEFMVSQRLTRVMSIVFHVQTENSSSGKHAASNRLTTHLKFTHLLSLANIFKREKYRAHASDG